MPFCTVYRFMQYKPTRSLCATVAIAATLALGSTPSLAQEAAPAIALEPAAPPPAVTPVIVLPPVTVQPTAPQPVAGAAPVARPAPRAQAVRPAATGAPAARAAVAPVAATPVVAAAIEPAAPVAQTPVPVNAAPVVTPRSEPKQQAASGLNGEEIGFLALLAALGVGGVAFAATSLRRRRRLNDAETVEEVEYAAAPPVSIATTSVRAEPRIDYAPLYDLVHEAPVSDMRVAEPPALSQGPVPTGEARQELLDRMVAADADEANPFTSGKCRRKRARLILQAREAEQQADTPAPFDWRTYEATKPRQREPELA